MLIKPIAFSCFGCRSCGGILRSLTCPQHWRKSSTEPFFKFQSSTWNYLLHWLHSSGFLSPKWPLLVSPLVDHFLVEAIPTKCKNTTIREYNMAKKYFWVLVIQFCVSRKKQFHKMLGKTYLCLFVVEVHLGALQCS